VVGCDVVGCDVVGCDVVGCDVVGCDVVGCDVVGCDVEAHRKKRVCDLDLGQSMWYQAGKVRRAEQLSVRLRVGPTA